MTRTRTTRDRATRLLAAPLLAGAMLAGSVGGADAFFWRRDPAPAPAPAPAAIAPTVPVPVLPPPRPGSTVGATAAAPAPRAGAPLAIVPQAVAPAAPPATTIARLGAAPLPPRPPADLPRGPAPAAEVRTAAIAAAPAAPVVTASAVAAPVSAPAAAPTIAAPPPAVAAPEPTRVAAVAPATDAEVVAAANAYFNGIDAITGRFTQVGSDGRSFSGVLYVDRPGKLRFQYDAPATIDVVADGRSVVVRDRQLGTQDMYPISQTPLKFLLGDRIRLGHDVEVVGVERAGDEVDVLLRDRSTFAGSSDIRLTFDAGLERLKEWRIVDAQGFETRVSLSGIERHAGLDQGLFRINYERLHRDDTY
ncbi:outer-membrane lipoprotein carrier protein LolA [Salinarimonas rosea]|uniref:outer-membrane lipoprotein carrier protein LolA n=1 Tax=Salinarimonas rosea TaxID=552063 RepID=UPI0003F5B327|nr:outer-membrane lipoprotein carrier protein LolA [Salinarimonas rosea]